MNTKSSMQNTAKRTSFRELLHDVRGATTVEYVIVLVLVGASAIGAWNTFGGRVRDKLKDAEIEMNGMELHPAESSGSGSEQ